MLTLLMQNPLVFLLIAVALVLSISVHEFAHALIADKLGDSTARQLGRLTIDPRAHLDTFGTLALLLLGFGWGKPVPFNPFNLKNPKRDAALISLAGPLSNFLLAGAFAIGLHLLSYFGVRLPVFQSFMYLVVTYNLVLGFFNLLPVHPLDGFKVVYGLLPARLAGQWNQLDRYGIFILLALIMTNATQVYLTPLVDFSTKLLGL